MTVTAAVKVVRAIPGLLVDLRRLYRRHVRPTQRRTGRQVRGLIPWVITLAVSLGFAALILTQTPAKVLAIFATPILLWIVFAHTDIALVVIMLLVCSFIDESMIPRVFELGGMGFYLSELLVILALFATVAKVLGARTKDKYVRSPLTLPVILTLGSVLFSMLVAYANWKGHGTGPYDFRASYNWARPWIYLLLFFITAHSLDTEKKLRRAVAILIIASVIVSGMIIVQQVMGYDQTIFSRYWYRGSGDNPGESASMQTTRLRVEAPGLHTMLMVVITAFALSVTYKLRHGAWYWLATAVIGLGLLVTWQRNYWICAILGAFILIVASARHVKWKLAIATMLWVLVVLIGFSVVAGVSRGGSGMVEDMGKRFSSLLTPKETLQTSSLQWRLYETRQVANVIRENPVFGIGVGNPLFYVTVDHGFARRWREPRYRVHNTYLMLYATYGMPGVIAATWLGIVFLMRAGSLYRRSNDQYLRILAITLIAAYIGFLFRAMFNQFPGDKAAIAILGFMYGAVEVGWRVHKQAEAKQLAEATLPADNGIEYPNGFARR